MKNNEFTNSTNCGAYKIFIITIICLAVLLVGVIVGILQIMIKYPHQTIRNDIMRNIQKTNDVDIVCNTENDDSYKEIQGYYSHLPKYLRITYEKIVVTDSLFVYSNNTLLAVNGLTDRSYEGNYIYICTDSEDMKTCLYHELAHTIDHPNIADTKYSNTDSWIKIHKIEGDEIALEEYNFEVYSAMPKEKQLRESFAMAFAMYYCEPEYLSKYFPEMYEYMSNFTMRMENDNKIK